MSGELLRATSPPRMQTMIIKNILPIRKFVMAIVTMRRSAKQEGIGPKIPPLLTEPIVTKPSIDKGAVTLIIGPESRSLPIKRPKMFRPIRIME
jgi:hypothetical protein